MQTSLQNCLQGKGCERHRVKDSPTAGVRVQSQK
ncbi:hypothetical protein OOU_Y34scaffold00566g3 [Pyricularia oryzae Y34]|uniref:Uncharacterized protein n=2 Tax=Pyricularia oryzae TaxID=318829 RepID=A0AA97NX48_PYRO3|nr:hypothetical protein OOU_Y34scaffold00566g3 [Pyricularia oryzae Y34]